MPDDILILGDGLLGSEVHRLTGWDVVSRKKDGIDICDPDSYVNHLAGYLQIFNCTGYTETYSEDRWRHWKVNYLAVINLTNILRRLNKKLIHVSTDYVYAGSKKFASETDVPVHTGNWYSYTKLLADGYIQAMSDNYLMFRCSFKPKPFPYEKAITTQEGNFVYGDAIAEMMIALIDGGAEGVYNVGNRQMRSVYALALETNPKVKPSSEVLHESMPENITMDVTKMVDFLERVMIWQK